MNSITSQEHKRLACTDGYANSATASRGTVLKMVLRQGLTLVLLGLAGGTVGALFLVRLMREVLYGVSPTDPLTFIAVALVLLSVAVVASIMPARRATMVNPISALRAN